MVYTLIYIYVWNAFLIDYNNIDRKMCHYDYKYSDGLENLKRKGMSLLKMTEMPVNKNTRYIGTSGISDFRGTCDSLQ